MRHLFIAAMFGLAFTCTVQETEAQVYSAGTTTTISGSGPIFYTSNYDSLEASESKEDTFKITEFQNSITFQIHADKVSGALGGNIVLEGSASKGMPFAPLQRFQLLNADTSYSYTIYGNPHAFYRQKITDTSATHVARYKTFITVR